MKSNKFTTKLVDLFVSPSGNNLKRNLEFVCGHLWNMSAFVLYC